MTVDQPTATPEPSDAELLERYTTAHTDVRAAGEVPGALARVWAANPPKPDRLAEFLAMVPELFERWDAYYDSEGPVVQASSLIEVSNWLFSMKNRWEQLGDDDDDE